jgi:hypothetical protein
MVGRMAFRGTYSDLNRRASLILDWYCLIDIMGNSDRCTFRKDHLDQSPSLIPFLIS